MFKGMDDTELTAFAISHFRNDLQMPVDLAMEVGLRGITPEMLASGIRLVREVELWDEAYDMTVVDFDQVIDADFDVAIGGTD
jgi:hypothetical protein